jgi:hypothetical protein
MSPAHSKIASRLIAGARQMTDEKGKGKVTPGTAPRIDSVSVIKGRTNKTTYAADAQEGDGRS